MIHDTKIYSNRILPAVNMLNKIKEHIDDKNKVLSIVKKHNADSKSLHCKFAYIEDKIENKVIIIFPEDLSFIIEITKSEWKSIWTK